MKLTIKLLEWLWTLTLIDGDNKMQQIVVQQINGLFTFVSMDKPFFKETHESVVRGTIVDMDHAIEKLGQKGANLAEKLIAIAGIESVSGCYHVLHIQKDQRFKWNELLPQIREAFVEIYGNKIRFLKTETFSFPA